MSDAYHDSMGEWPPFPNVFDVRAAAWLCKSYNSKTGAPIEDVKQKLLDSCVYKTKREENKWKKIIERGVQNALTSNLLIWDKENNNIVVVVAK